jgi:hypothetical protein
MSGTKKQQIPERDLNSILAPLPRISEANPVIPTNWNSNPSLCEGFGVFE